MAEKETVNDKYYIEKGPSGDIETVIEHFRHHHEPFNTVIRRKFRTVGEAIDFHTHEKSKEEMGLVTFPVGIASLGSGIVFESLAITNSHELDIRTIFEAGAIILFGLLLLLKSKDQFDSSTQHDKMLKAIYSSIDLKPKE